ncbi:MAG TPA: hypothetical protein VFQ56_04745 [Flavobacterium sp.]|nr:hypothetical protein [Flavobacterium sp.]
MNNSYSYDTGVKPGAQSMHLVLARTYNTGLKYFVGSSSKHY